MGSSFNTSATGTNLLISSKIVRSGIAIAAAMTWAFAIICVASLNAQTTVRDWMFSFNALGSSTKFYYHFEDIDRTPYDPNSFTTIGSANGRDFVITQFRLDGTVNPDFGFKFWRFTDQAINRAYFAQIEEVDKRLCSSTSGTRQYFAGAHNSGLCVSISLGNGYGTTAFLLFAPNFATDGCWYLYNDAASPSLIRNYCQHNLRSDPVGRRFGSNLSTVHSYLSSGWGSSKIQPLYTDMAILVGQTIAPPQLNPGDLSLAPIARSYNVDDGAQGTVVKRDTRFYDNSIDNGRVVPNYDPDPVRNQKLLCDGWQATVVGRKLLRADGTNPQHTWGLITEVNAALIPLVNQTHVYQFIEPGLDGKIVDCEFRRIVPTYDENGMKVGHLVCGFGKAATPQGDPARSYVIFLKLRQCGHDDVAWRSFVRIDGLDIRDVRSVIQDKPGKYVAVVRVGDYEHYFRLKDLGPSHVESIWKDKLTGVIQTADIEARQATLNDEATFEAVGDIQYNSTTQPDVSWYQHNVKLRTSELECDQEQVFFDEVPLIEVKEMRKLISFEEEMRGKTIEIAAPEVTVDRCIKAVPCEGDGKDGTVEVWGSHYDRGNAVSYFNGNEVISTGLCAGPYFKRVDNGSGCFVCDGVNVNYPAMYNMDIDLTYTDANLQHSDLTRHGWYRLLTDKEDVPVQCAIGSLPLELEPGNSSFDVGFGISFDQDEVVISGENIETRPSSTDHCPTNYEPHGDVDASLFEVHGLRSGTLPQARALFFGKEHDDIPTVLSGFGGEFFLPVEKNYSIFDLNRTPQDDAGVYKYNDYPNSRMAEVFFDVVALKNGYLPQSQQIDWVAVGLTTSYDYDYVATPPYYNLDAPLTPFKNAARKRKALLFATSTYWGKETCGDINSKWAATIASSAINDPHCSLSSVSEVRTNDEPSGIIAVGLTQGGNGYYQMTANKWIGGVVGAGVILQTNLANSPLLAAKIGIYNGNCPDVSDPDGYSRLVRLFDVSTIDENEDGTTDGCVVVGGVVLPSDNELREHILVVKLDATMGLVWKKVLVITPYNKNIYSSVARSVSVTSKGDIKVVGIVTGISPEIGADDDSFFIEMDKDGAVFNSVKLLRPSDCDNAEKDNHIESISVLGSETSVIGSSCRYGQPPFNTATDYCDICSFEKGQRIGARWKCASEATASHMQAIVVKEMSKADHSADFGDEAVELSRLIDIRVSTNLSSLSLLYEPIENICNFIRLKDVYVVKEVIDTECTTEANDPHNNALLGTTHAKESIGAMPCWP